MKLNIVKSPPTNKARNSHNFDFFRLIASLARDLKEELYEDFPDIFREIHAVVNRFHHTTEIIEQSFTTLSYLIYFMKDVAKNDITNVFK